MRVFILGLFGPQQAAVTAIIALCGVVQTHLAQGRLTDDRDLGLPLGYQPRHPHQVVRGSNQLPIQSGSPHPTIPTPSKTSHCLHPPEDRLHSLSYLVQSLLGIVRPHLLPVSASVLSPAPAPSTRLLGCLQPPTPQPKSAENYSDAPKCPNRHKILTANPPIYTGISHAPGMIYAPHIRKEGIR